MNWDWEKLQEKRQRQPGANKPSQQGPGTPPPKLPNFGEKFKNFKPNSFPIKFLLIIVVILWGLSGIFIVRPDEEGVILRFGQYNRTVQPGPHIRLPYPLESHLTPKVTQVMRIEVGFRTPPNASSTVQSQVRAVPEEASMLTSDENIVSVQFIIQYRIADSFKYLFNVARQHEAVKSAGEAAMREAIGKSKIDAALTEGKVEIQNETKRLLQDILNRYDSGISVIAVQMQDVHVPMEVMSAFRDVASAREDRVRSTNLADAYRNQIIPEAQGEAARIINEAEAYREAAIRRAEGESQRFLSVLAEYNKAQDVTRKRLYIETMEAILGSAGVEKIIMPHATGANTLPLLPLNAGGSLPAQPSAK